MSRAWEWIATTWRAASRWIRRNWAWLRGALIVSSIVVSGAWVYSRIAPMIAKPKPWSRVEGDPHRIDIQDGNQLVCIMLPQGVTSDQVIAAGIDNGRWAVEVKHEPTDRTGDVARGRDSDLGL